MLLKASREQLKLGALPKALKTGICSAAVFTKIPKIPKVFSSGVPFELIKDCFQPRNLVSN